VPDIPMFRQNTAAFVHEMPPGTFANLNGDGNYVRVQVLTNVGALDRDKQRPCRESLPKNLVAIGGLRTGFGRSHEPGPYASICRCCRGWGPTPWPWPDRSAYARIGHCDCPTSLFSRVRDGTPRLTTDRGSVAAPFHGVINA
jgi:hypothetical protein